MVKRGKMKAKLDQDHEEETQKSVILLSSDEEANEDLTLKIVERSKSREMKRRRAEDFDEFKASDGVRSVSVINLSSSDEVEMVAAADRNGGAGAEIQYAELKKKKTKKKKKKKSSSSQKIAEKQQKQEKAAGDLNSEEPVEAITSVDTTTEVEDLVYTVTTEKVAEPVEAKESVETNAVEKSDNIVMRKLLRGPRYFDPPNSSFSSTCYNCGEEGHMAVNCTSKRRKKPCFVCGSFEHGVRKCTQGKDCYICKKRGHRAKDCPEKHQQSSLNSFNVCLRCGESGHNMFSCTSDYAPEDLKEIECYVCKKLGHLCCIGTVDAGKGEISCYNCGQTGHAGLGCAKQRGEISGAGTPTLCYKCGEEGHFARGCTKYSKPDFRAAKSSTPIQKFKKKVMSPGFQSAPPDARKVYKKKNVDYGARDFSTPPGRSNKRRGGWIPDDAVDLPNRKFKAHVWRAPSSTPSNSNYHHHRSPNFATPPNYTPPGGHFSNSGSPWGIPSYSHGTPPTSHGSGNYYPHRFQASRFGGNSSGGWSRTNEW